MIRRHFRKRSVILALLISFLFLFIGVVVHMRLYKQLPPQSNSTAYGVNVDMTAIIPSTPYTITTVQGGDFFSLAAHLGINTLRITDVRWAVTGQEYSRTIWNHVFNEAERYHIHIILLLVDGGKHTALEHAHTLLGQYRLAQSPALWMVDLDNEPDVDDPQQISEIQQEATYVHQVVPSVRITIGGWKHEIPGHPNEFRYQDPTDIPKLINLVDVVSVHLYQFDQGIRQGFTPQQWVQRYLNAVRSQTQGKPVLLEEFGAGNGLAPTTEAISTGNIQWQAYVYQSVFQEVKSERAQGVLGALAWIIAPRPSRAPISSNYERDMTGWAFVLNQGKRLLPAAQTFSDAEHSG